ncbi:MAG: hypothetical protein Q8Q94_00955 [bacterium]|nr:hypothetical protein [bacterium]
MKTKLFTLLMVVSMPFIAFANGGDQRVADGYLVNLSRAPFTPIVGVKTALLASFVDLKTGNLIKNDILVSIRIAEGRGSRAFIHEKKDIPIRGGVLEYLYTFQNPGIHEIFFDFKLVNDPEQKVHELPDFLLDVQKPTSKKMLDNKSFIFGICVGIVSGLIIEWLLGKRQNVRL